jgi:alkaline phosphatase
MQSHLRDPGWAIRETIEFDSALRKCQEFARSTQKRENK